MNAPAFFVELDRFLQERGIRHFSAREICPIGKVTRHRKTGAEVRLQAAPRSSWGNLIPTLEVLEWLRPQTGPLLVNCGYRDVAYNDAVQGGARSLHLVFNAIDFRSSRNSPLELAELLRKHPKSKQLGIGVYAGFVHVDTRGMIGRPAPARWGVPKR